VAEDALHEELFVAPYEPGARADRATRLLPPSEKLALFSGRTPWPNAISAVAASDLVMLAEASGRADLVLLARRLGPGKIVLSKLMARRYRVVEGDALELSGRGGTRSLEIVAITDGLGFLPIRAPYRNAKTFGVIDAADMDLIAPYADSIGANAVIPDGRRPEVERWGPRLRTVAYADRRLVEAAWYRRLRLRETDRDFVIFDSDPGADQRARRGRHRQTSSSSRCGPRAREIALYRVLGMTTQQVRRLVLLEGGFVGLLGGALAALLGVPLGYAAVNSLRAVSAFDVSFDLPPHYVLLTLVGSVLIALAASLYPAVRATRTDAAESVHYE